MATPFAAVVGFALAVRGASGTGTKQYPGQPQFNAQAYQFMGQQPFQADPMLLQAQPQGLPQMPLLNWGQPALQMGAPGAQQLLQQAQLAQPAPQPPQFQAQPAPQAEEGAEAEAAAPALPQLQHGTASLSMQDVMNLVDNVHTLQKKTKGLEKQLSDAHAHEKQLNDMAYAAQYRSSSVDQSARKLAQLAQTSVLQAQQSMDQEKAVVDDMKKRLVDAEKERVALQEDLSQAQAKMKGLQEAVASSQRKEQEAVEAQKAAERGAREAAARELRALKAGELEDSALSRQEALIDRIRGAAPPAALPGDFDARAAPRPSGFVQYPESPRFRTVAGDSSALRPSGFAQYSESPQMRALASDVALRPERQLASPSLLGDRSLELARRGQSFLEERRPPSGQGFLDGRP